MLRRSVSQVGPNLQRNGTYPLCARGRCCDAAAMANDKFISRLLGVRALLVAVLLGTTAAVGAYSQERPVLAVGCAVVTAALLGIGLWSLRRAR